MDEDAAASAEVRQEDLLQLRLIQASVTYLESRPIAQNQRRRIGRNRNRKEPYVGQRCRRGGECRRVWGRRHRRGRVGNVAASVGWRAECSRPDRHGRGRCSRPRPTGRQRRSGMSWNMAACHREKASAIQQRRHAVDFRPASKLSLIDGSERLNPWDETLMAARIGRLPSTARFLQSRRTRASDRL